MRCVIVLNGEFTDNFEFLADDHIIACDGAYEKLLSRGITPNEVLGDFDSLGYVPDGAIVYPSEKDMTDGELALMRADELGFKSLAIICAGGGRDDHFIGNLSVLIKAFDFGFAAAMYTKRSVIYCVGHGGHRFTVSKGSIVSLFSFNSAIVTESKELKYPYHDVCLDDSSTLSVSNEAIENEIFFYVEKGIVLLFVNL